MTLADLKTALVESHPTIRPLAIEVAVAAVRLLSTPIVDDDFPEQKDLYLLAVARLDRARVK